MKTFKVAEKLMTRPDAPERWSLDHNPANCDRANLKALCAPCHLRYDAQLHRANAAKTRAAKREKRDQTIGQLSLIDELCRPSPLTPLD